MKLSHSILSRFIDLPRDASAVRNLLDDVGIEVKRSEPKDGDTVFTVELLANRGDHYCYAGAAREVSGRTGSPVQLPASATIQTGTAPVPVHIETPRCSLYSLTELVLEGEPGSLSTSALAVLEAAGLHSVSAPVDATNIANAELGQPTHAFDADTIEGEVVVRDSRPGETAWLLFTEGPVEVPPGTMVIADASKILAIAGVIGCEESKSTESTRRVLLESAAFDPVAVRLASRALGQHTDSSARFERGSDASLVLTGAGRVAQLMGEAGWRLTGRSALVGSWEDERRTLALNVPRAGAFLEYPLTYDDVRERLQRYGFAVSPEYPEWDAEDEWSTPESLADVGRDELRNTLLVRVPPHRVWDVEFAQDLYEELAKSIGYSQTPEHLPRIDMGAVPSLAELNRDKVEEVLLAAGFYEVFTDGFHGRDLPEKAGVREGHPLAEHVETENALDRGYSLLKNNALYQAVEAVAVNANMRTSEVKIYEWTRTFHPAASGVCTERALLWGLCSGHATTPSWAGGERKADPFFVKGLVDNIATALRLPLTVGPATPPSPLASLLHPHRQAHILLDGHAVGVLGEVHPLVLRGFKVKRARPVYFELDASVLSESPRRVRYVEPSNQHDIERSLAFFLPHGVSAGEIATQLSRNSPDWCRAVDIVDEFGLEGGRAVTFALRFASGDGRSSDEVNAVADGLIQAINARFENRGVSLRA